MRPFIRPHEEHPPIIDAILAISEDDLTDLGICIVEVVEECPDSIMLTICQRQWLGYILISEEHDHNTLSLVAAQKLNSLFVITETFSPPTMLKEAIASIVHAIND